MGSIHEFRCFLWALSVALTLAAPPPRRKHVGDPSPTPGPTELTTGGFGDAPTADVRWPPVAALSLSAGSSEPVVPTIRWGAASAAHVEHARDAQATHRLRWRCARDRGRNCGANGVRFAELKVPIRIGVLLNECGVALISTCWYDACMGSYECCLIAGALNTCDSR